MISYGRQTIEEDDIQVVSDVLRGDYITQGPKISEFENELSDKFGSKYTSVVANGTASLHLIALALGWKSGDIIITSPITFVASANCILYVSATPDFVDIDNNNYTIDPNKLEDKIKFYRDKGINIKAVVAVDFAGNPCDWEALRLLANKYEFQLVNDFCHALGAEYNGDYQYAVKYADVVNMSFHPVKHITSGEGGAALTNKREIDNKIKLLRTHGIAKDPKFQKENSGPWYYEMQYLGFNYRITDIQCALGLNQLKKLNRFVKRRRKIAEYYDQEFEENSRFIVPKVKVSNKHAYHLYPLQVKFEEIKLNKSKFFRNLKKENILLQVHYIPVHLQPFYRETYGFKNGDFPISETFYQNEVSIPMFPSLTDDEIKLVANKIKRFSA